MSRKIIQIDEDKCVGCGLCANACQQSAIEIIDGKAKVVRDDYCDGIGNCMPVCPVDAISFSDRDIIGKKAEGTSTATSCPSTSGFSCPSNVAKSLNATAVTDAPTAEACPSQLKQWPVQIKLAPVNAPYFNDCHLLIAADCTAYAYGNFHNDFMKDKVTLIGCPKLDLGDYTEKLTEILLYNNIKSVTVARMEVPCCGGIENATKNALIHSGKSINSDIITISIHGEIRK